MNQSQLERLNAWFRYYANGFLSEDPKEDPEIQFKIEHTSRVIVNILELAASLNLNPHDRYIAEAVGLLHDVGRFEQFLKYGTYNDLISVDHAELGLQILTAKQVLKDLIEEERTIVETAIRYHNKFLLPQEIPKHCREFCKLIRDADKLDILEQYARALTQTSPTGSGCSREVIDSVLAGKVVSFKMVKTGDDVKLMRMSWIMDINYTLALKKLQDQHFLEKVLETIEPTADVLQAYNYLKSYLIQKLG